MSSAYCLAFTIDPSPSEPHWRAVLSEILCRHFVVRRRTSLSEFSVGILLLSLRHQTIAVMASLSGLLCWHFTRRGLLVEAWISGFHRWAFTVDPSASNLHCRTFLSGILYRHFTAEPSPLGLAVGSSLSGLLCRQFTFAVMDSLSLGFHRRSFAVGPSLSQFTVGDSLSALDCRVFTVGPSRSWPLSELRCRRFSVGISLLSLRRRDFSVDLVKAHR